jgi:hypothetical protein
VRAAAAGLALLAACCATTPVPKPRPPTHPEPAAEELMAALAQRHQRLRTMEFETKTTSWLGSERVRATVLMMVDRAGRLRFEAEVPVQGPVASLTVNGRDFAFLDLEKHLFRRGPACPANVALMIPIPLRPEEIAAILLGDAPLGERARPAGVSWDGVVQADVLALDRSTEGDGAAKLWITMRRRANPAGYDVLAVEGQSLGASARWRVAFGDLERVAGSEEPLPKEIRFAEPGKSFDDGVEILIKIRMGVNRALRDESFVLSPPAGYKVETLLCGGATLQKPPG